MMAELSDIVNETARGEIEEFLEDPAEIECSIKLFAAASPEMQEIAEAVIIGEHKEVDSLLATAQGSISAT